MVRFVIDPPAVIELARGSVDIAAGQLQADCLIALDPGLATRAGGLIAPAPLAAFGMEGWPPPGL